MLGELDDLGEVIDVVAKVDWDGLDGAEVGQALVDIESLRARLDAATLAATSAFERSLAWARDGSLSAAAWLAQRTRMPPPRAKRQLRMARSLQAMGHTTAALGDGTISADHAWRLVRLNTARLAGEFGAAEHYLVDAARRLCFADFERVAAYWQAHADPDGADDRADRHHHQRRLHASRTIDGMGRIDAWLDPIGFTEFKASLERIEARLFAADWAHARHSHGDTATVADLARTPAQRRADALVEMARTAAATPAGARRPEPLLVVHMNHATLTAEVARAEGRHVRVAGETLCELDDGTLIPPSLALTVATQGWIRRLVVGPDSTIIDYGRARRTFPKHVADAIAYRDRRCQAPGCQRPASQCQIDHIIEWAHGGPTNANNAQALCGPHNRRKHHQTRPPPHHTRAQRPTTNREPPDP